MHTEAVSWATLTPPPGPDLQVLGVQADGPDRYRGLLVTATGAQGQFHVTLHADRIALSAFGVQRTLPRLARAADWDTQEPCIVLGLALITAAL